LPKTLRYDNSWQDSLEIVASLPPIDYSHVLDGKQKALCTFQNALICLDIISCTSTGREPKFAMKFRDSFRADNGPVRAEQMTGCQNVVMECIMDIAILHHWKEKVKSNQSMSLTELVKRALLLESGLQQIRKKNFERITSQSLLTSSVEDTWIITNVYACAATVYLHATVSGPHPEIPEIKNGVVDTIQALKLLPRAGLLKRLMWPVCVAACLAEGECREFFEVLDEGMREEFGNSQTISRAFGVSRECWKLRRYGTADKRACDWRDAMLSLGDVLLLF
jgi:C6 transcription factor Pro1